MSFCVSSATAACIAAVIVAIRAIFAEAFAARLAPLKRKPLTRLGAQSRSWRHPAAGVAARAAARLVAGIVQISAQHCRGDPYRAQFDRRGWRGAVGRHPTGSGAEGDSRRGRLSIGMDRADRHPRTGSRRLALGCARPPLGRVSSVCCGGRRDNACRLPARCLYRRRIGVFPNAALGQLFLECQLFGRLSIHGRTMAGEVASQRLRSRLWLFEHCQVYRPGPAWR